MFLPSQILIAGVGNVLLSDDGVGVYVVRELRKNPMPGVTIAEIGTAILHGLHFLESAERVLVIDAAKGGRAPGTVYLFEATENTQAKSITSIHSMGLREAARFLTAGRPAPPITVVGVEPETLDYGMDLSGPVKAALPVVLALARETVAGWLRKNVAEERACLTVT
jgi:hydrogenase maturation protease